ncbi:MAG: hypothetical protein JST40_03855 [Armatimonadetes bacterium]|nr:hypothetical protein [Armatimonadota bacterium]
MSTALVRFPCAQCGAELQFKPGTTHMVCPYCGFEQNIAPSTATVDELPLEAYFDKQELTPEPVEAQQLRCKGCGAVFTAHENRATQECPFCGSEVVQETTKGSRIPPNGVLPFLLTDLQARAKMNDWLGSRFWAPNDLKKLALKEGKLRGMYIPYWTFDSYTITHYTGARGEHYWETETYTTTENGQSVTRTRQVMKTRWYPASGTVEVPFDDVLVLASQEIPMKYGQRLQNWDLAAAAPYTESFVAGFQTQLYDIDLKSGWATAQTFMQPGIDSAICADIGGDEQQIHSKSTEYLNCTFKHLLLPMYSGAYRYRTKPYQVLVNGRTGEVQGSAPISFWKVLIATILGLIVVGVCIYFYMQSQKGS